MNVYVESNFVLELALEQEEVESCSTIIRLALEKRLNLVIPAFALAEPYQAISNKEKARSRLASDLSSHLGELSRSKPHREMPAAFGAFEQALINRAQFEREGLRRATSAIMQSAEVIPLDVACLRAGANLETKFGLSNQDALILASVLGHIETSKPATSCFLSRNSRDFDDPDIRDRLDQLNCRFFAKFAHALGHISSQLKSEP